MNYFKNVFIATILLNLAMIFASEYSAYTQEVPTNSEEQVNVPEATPAPEETPQEPAQPLTDEQTWNNHLAALKESDDNWNSANNLPTNSWKETAITLAKTLLDKDKTIAENLKTEFLNTVSTAIEQKNGTFSSAYNFIQEFNNSIDAYVATLTQPEIKDEPKPVEEVTQPVTETPAPAPVEQAPAPTPAPEEQKITPTETAPTTETPQDIIQQWNSILENITKEGTTLEGNRTLLQKAYPIARELFVQKPASAETIQSNLENALNEHNQNLLLEPINIQQAMIAFSEATGISLEKEIEKQQIQERKTEQKTATEKQKEAALKIAMLERIGEQTPAPASKSSEIADLTTRLKQKLMSMETESDQKIASLKQELATLRKTKEKAPETPGGVWGTLKNIASSASQWWYGDTESIAALDKERREKLQELLAAMPLTDNQKLFIEEKWNTFISNLRTFKDLDTDDARATKQWLIEIEQALEYITITNHIISIKDALDITKDALKEQPESAKFINEIKKYLEEKRYKIIQEKQQKENEQTKKREAQEMKIRKQQQLKEEKRLKKAEKQTLVSQQQQYLHEIYDWHQFLKKIAENKQATNHDNHTYTKEAIKKAHVLINHAALLSPEEKNIREQNVKHEFSNALLEQQRDNDITTNAINIHKNMDQFNAAM